MRGVLRSDEDRLGRRSPRSCMPIVRLAKGAQLLLAVNEPAFLFGIWLDTILVAAGFLLALDVLAPSALGNGADTFVTGGAA